MRLAEDMLKCELIPAKDFIYYGGGHELKSRFGKKRGEQYEIKLDEKAKSKRKKRVLLKCMDAKNEKKLDKGCDKETRSVTQRAPRTRRKKDSSKEA